MESQSCAFSLVVAAFFIHKFNCLTLSSNNFFPVATLSSQWTNTERSTVAFLIPCYEHIPRRVMCMSKIDLQLPRHLKEWKEREGSGWTAIYFVFLQRDKFQWLPAVYQSTKFCLGETKYYLNEKVLSYLFTEDQKNLWIWLLATSLICFWEKFWSSSKIKTEPSYQLPRFIAFFV